MLKLPKLWTHFKALCCFYWMENAITQPTKHAVKHAEVISKRDSCYETEMYLMVIMQVKNSLFEKSSTHVLPALFWDYGCILSASAVGLILFYRRRDPVELIFKCPKRSTLFVCSKRNRFVFKTTIYMWSPLQQLGKDFWWICHRNKTKPFWYLRHRSAKSLLTWGTGYWAFCRENNLSKGLIIRPTKSINSRSTPHVLLNMDVNIWSG